MSGRPLEALALRRRQGVYRDALAFAVAGLVVLALTAWVALYTARGQALDEQARSAVSGPPVTIHRMVEGLNWVSVGSVGLALLACLGVALARRRLVVALGAVVLVAGANLTTQVVKHVVLHRPDLGLGTSNSLPSGHTTVGLSLALAAVLVAPPAWRTLVTLLGAFTATLVGAGTVIAAWHRPSDVVAAIAVCAVWAGPTLVLVARGARFDPPTGPPPATTHLVALLGAGTVGALVLSWGVRPSGGDRNLLLAAASLGAIGLACVVVLAGFSLAVDHALD